MPLYPFFVNPSAIDFHRLLSGSQVDFSFFLVENVESRFLQTPPQTPSGLIPVGNTSRLDGCSLHKAIACFGRSILSKSQQCSSLISQTASRLKKSGQAHLKTS